MNAVSFDVKDLSLADRDRERIDWALQEMPVLRELLARVQDRRPLEGITMSGCVHITTETANLARVLQAAGADLVLRVSNPLSTQDDVAASRVRDFEISVHAIRGEDRDTYYRHINAALDHAPVLVMDDGADLISEMHKSRKKLLQEMLGGTEETTTGVVRLRAMARGYISRVVRTTATAAEGSARMRTG